MVSHLTKQLMHPLILWVFVPWSIFSPNLARQMDGSFGLPKSVRVQIGSRDCKSGKAFNVRTASTVPEQAKGLSGRRSSLSQKEGMIFIFSPPQAAGFWMKNTHIPLSIHFFYETGSLLSSRKMEVERDPDHPIQFYTEANPVSVALEIAPEYWNQFKAGESFLCFESIGRTKE